MNKLAAQTVSPRDTTESDLGLRRVMGPGLLLLFIVGDILGTGIYALTGQVAKEVGGVAWLPFVVAFGVALMTAFSYLELVTKYPRAAGAALYAHKAFGIHFVTFIVAFAVMCSGITSASTASRAFAANLSTSFHLGYQGAGITLLALLFMALVAAVNLRGVGESVKVNVVLTVVELTGLLIVILVGLWAIGAGQGDVSRALTFEPAGDRGVFWSVMTATTLAFFAMVGFEDSVNMAEETKDPSKIFPKVLLTGLLITVVIYVLVSISAVTLVSPAELGQGEAPLLKVVAAGAPGVSALGVRCDHDVRGGQLGVDQHVDGEPSRLWDEPRGRAPARPRQGACGQAHAVSCDRLHVAAGVRPHHLRRDSPGPWRNDGAAPACRIRRRQCRCPCASEDKVDHEHFRTPTSVAVWALSLCLSRGALDGSRSGAVRDCRRSPRHRSGAVVRHRPGDAFVRLQVLAGRAATGPRVLPVDPTECWTGPLWSPRPAGPGAQASVATFMRTMAAHGVSPRTMIPTMNAPTAPMPVQMVYAVPSGKERIDAARRTKLKTIVTTVTTEGHSRVNPSDCFIEKAQTISSKPAAMSMIHATADSLLLDRRAVPDLNPVEGGRTWPRRAQVGMPRASSTTGRRPSAAR
jgi:hypothetical protein